MLSERLRNYAKDETIILAVPSGGVPVAQDDSVLLNQHLVNALRINEEEISSSVSVARQEIAQRVMKFQSGGLFASIEGRDVISIDDGLASGFTMLAAVNSIRCVKPKKVVVAAPTASTTSLHLLESGVDELVCLNIKDE